MAYQLHLKLCEVFARLRAGRRLETASMDLSKPNTPDQPEQLCDEKPGSVGRGRAEDIAYSDFSL